MRRYDTMTTSDLVRLYDEVLRELHGPDYADQAETLHELEYVIRARTGHDVRCSTLRGALHCDRRCDRPLHGVGFVSEKPGMPTYNVSLSLTRPPSLGDAELVELLRHAVKRAMCEAIEVAPAGMVVECGAAALERLETELRSDLEARGGSLGRMIVRPI